MRRWIPYWLWGGVAMAVATGLAWLLTPNDPPLPPEATSLHVGEAGGFVYVSIFDGGAPALILLSPAQSAELSRSLERLAVKAGGASAEGAAPCGTRASLRGGT